MKAPDKLYLHPNYKGEVGANWLTFSLINEDVCYIRKDALLKWIQEARSIPHENAITRDLAFQEIVNKLNSM